MRSDEIAGARDLLEEFVQEVFASFPRNEQRGKGSLYLQGLMLEGRRKSMQPMGGRLGVDYQQLQQFGSSSPWPVEPVRRVWQPGPWLYAWACSTQSRSGSEYRRKCVRRTHPIH